VDIKRRRSSLEINEQISKIEVVEECDFSINIRASELTEIIGSTEEPFRIEFHFKQIDISSDIYVGVILDAPINFNLEILVKAEYGISGVESKLSMRSLVLDPLSSITFVPMLEIDDMDVSVDHKSSIGAPDPDYIWYLQSRGLNYDKAVSLLIDAFLRG
jgi:hypothetical protein